MAQAFGSGMQADAEPAKPARRKRPVGEAYAPPLTVAAAPTASVPGGFEMPSAPSVPRSVRLAFDEPAAAEAFAQAFSDPGTRQAAADAFAVLCAVVHQAAAEEATLAEDVTVDSVAARQGDDGETSLEVRTSHRGEPAGSAADLGVYGCHVTKCCQISANVC